MLLVVGYWYIILYVQSGKVVLVCFICDELYWEFWLVDKLLVEFNVEEQVILVKYGYSDFFYFCLLVCNQLVLEQWILIDKGIFYIVGGLLCVECELVVMVVSKINGCIYCVLVYVCKVVQLVKDEIVVDMLLVVMLGEDLCDG